MTSIAKNIVKKYNNKYQNTIKTKPADVKRDIYRLEKKTKKRP